MPAFELNLYQRADIDKHIIKRDGEKKVGQAISVLQASSTTSLPSDLGKAKSTGAKYAIVLIPEDIGPRANFGRAGADEAPESFLNFFLNMQSNLFLDCSKILILGEIDVTDLMDQSKKYSDQQLDALRQLCAQLDDRVAPVVEAIVLAGLEPIVIGGGNNNSFPTIKGVVKALRHLRDDADIGMAVANCDPHADFRVEEGRHSGNPFTYANKEGYLKRYGVFGLHESYNSHEMLTRLTKCGFATFPYEDFNVRRATTFDGALKKLLDYLYDGGHPVGCELDLDSIENMPSSARTPFGISNAQAARFLHAVASSTKTVYLHISEGAPRSSNDDGYRTVGKSLAFLVTSYLKAREQFHSGGHWPTYVDEGV